MFTKDLMKRVHEIARGLEGHYHARLSLAFAIIRKGEVKEMDMKITVNGFEFDLTEKEERVNQLVEEFKKDFEYKSEEFKKEYKEFVLKGLEGASQMRCKLSAPQLKALEILGL